MCHRRELAVLCVSAVAVMSMHRAGEAAGVARSPGGDVACTWEPMRWRYGPHIGNALEARITGQKDQGYTTANRRYFDPSPHGNVGTCTTSNFENFPLLDTGIALVEAEGGTRQINEGGWMGFMHAAASTSLWRLNSWVNAAMDRADMRVKWVPEDAMFAVEVDAPWFSRNWAPHFGAIGSIVFLATCKGASTSELVTPLLPAFGMRTGFGYSEVVTHAMALADLELLFDTMNGHRPEGEQARYRRAGEAYRRNEGDFKGWLQIVGQEDTTLCPSVDHSHPKPFTPVGPGDGMGGPGRVTFDTHVDTSVPPDKVITIEVTSPDLIVDQVRWEGTNALRFNYWTLECRLDYEAEVTVRAQGPHRVRAAPGWQALDGGSPETGEDCAPDVHGVAPNADPFLWRFDSREQ